MEQLSFLKTSWGKIALGVVALALAFGGGYNAGTSPTSTSTVSLLLDNDASSYVFLHPLLGVIVPKAWGQVKFKSLTDQVEADAASEPAGSIDRYAFYYKDMSSTLWTGINETDQYDPGSLLKLAFAVSVYKQAESDPGILYRQLTYTPSVANIQSNFADALPTNLVVGQSYSVPYLVKDMLEDSDNGAKDLLVTSLNSDIIDQAFKDLSITLPASPDYPGFTISAQEFSRFLRILYYGTYDIQWGDSNQLLQYLANSTYTEGLVAGVPKGVVVAHKYGEQLATADGKPSGIELSDCGIVYHPKNPYLICVMTQGTNATELAAFIAKVSATTYAAADAGFK